MIHSTAFPHRARGALFASLLALAAAMPALAAGTLDKARETGKLSIGYSSDARPIAYSDASGKAAGYAIELCSKVADAVKGDLKLPALAVEFVALPHGESLNAVAQGKVDLLCGAVPTLERRALVDFSIPILLSGASVAIRADAPARLVQVLSGRESSGVPWRASPELAPHRASIAVIGGTTLEKAVSDALKRRRIVAEVVPVKDAAAGFDQLAAGNVQAFFADRALLLDAAARSKADTVVLDRLFRRDLVALALRRDDDDFRLAVDRALSRLYRTDDMAAFYGRYFGAPSASVSEFFQLVALPD